MSDERWYFSKEQLENSPSKKLGIDADKELNYKQQAASLIYDMASRKLLSVNQLCISTAIVYMHRFYVFHSFSHFQWNSIAMASLFLAAKVEEQTRKLEHVIKVAQWCLQKNHAYVNCGSQSYFDQIQELVLNENILLQTLGFDLNIKHPHTFVVEFCEKIRLSKDLTKTMYGMASNSLSLTTMCVRYKPSVVACFCIHFICKRWNYQIDMNDESRPWWSYIDQSVTQELLNQMVEEFSYAYVKAPARLKNKIHELLNCRNITIHHIDSEFDTNGQPSSDSFCYSTASSSSSSSTSMIQFHTNYKTSVDTHNTPGLTRGHKSSTASLSNHLRTSHSTINTSTSLALITNSIDAISSVKIASTQFSKNNPAAHPSSSQHLHRHSQHQQHHYHRYHSSETSSNSKQPHKTGSTGVTHRPKPMAIGHLTSCSDNNVVFVKDTAKLDRRKTNESTQKSDFRVKHETDYHSSKFPLSTVDAADNSDQKADDKSRECDPILTNSHSNQGNESSTNKVNLYAATDIVDGVACNVEISNISSPSSVRHDSFFPDELVIKQEPFTAATQMQQDSAVNGMYERKDQQNQPAIHISGFSTVGLKIETVSEYENTFSESKITVPSSGNSTEPSAYTPVITNVVSLAPLLNEQLIKEEPTEIKTESLENPSLVQKPIEERPLSSEKIDNVAVSECSSESRKENEKDKRHKEKKRHKEDKQRRHHHYHRKEHGSGEKERKLPGPIKITIPKEKLTDIPLKPKLKFNLNQIVASSTFGKVTNNDDVLRNKFQNESKSRKRKRESDLDLSSSVLSKHSQNNFKD